MAIFPVPPSSISRIGNTSDGLISSTALPSKGLMPSTIMQVGEGRHCVNSMNGELLHAHQIHRDVSAQVSRKARRQVAGEIFVQQLDRAKLILGDPVGPPEIVKLDLLARRIRSAGAHLFEYVVDFLLRKNAVSGHVR